jgi:hypothetical protein
MEHGWRGQGKRTSVEAYVVFVRMKSLGESKEQGEQAEAANARVLDHGSSHCSAWGILPEKLAIIVDWKNVTFKAISLFEGH